MNKQLNFGGDPRHGSVPDPDPNRDTGKTCFSGGMHCPSAYMNMHLHCRL